MKKNISINISGIIFHIEEDGYDKLKEYLDTIHRYFASYDDSSEIIADIENRIAEIFLSKLKDGKQVITLEDVEALMATMGGIKDFKEIEIEEEYEERSEEKTYASEEEKEYSAEPKKLFRDERRKILGGILAGIAHYFSMDPLWIRLMFIVLFFGIWFFPATPALLIVAYVVLWIVVPGSYELKEGKKVKKMYRNPDDKVLGGVASGVAAYFGVDVVVIRLLFIVLIFFGGTGIILYIILWIILPEAITITDKMEMQGEPVTLRNIESNIKKSFKVSDDDDESVLTKILLFPFRLIAALINFLSKALGPIAAFLVEAIRVIFGLVLVLAGITLTLVLIAALGAAFGVLTGGFLVEAIDFPIHLIRDEISALPVIAGFVAGWIPLIFLVILGISIITKNLLLNAKIAWSLFALWIISLLVMLFTIPPLVGQYSRDGVHTEVENFSMPDKILFLDVNDVGLEDYEAATIRLRGHEDTLFRLEKRFEARGKSREDAIENAKMIDYTVDIRDSVILFDSNIQFREDARFRGQDLEATLYMPYNRPFQMDYDMRYILRNTIYYYGYRVHHIDENTWMFTTEGLKCITCPENDEEPNVSDTNEFDSSRSFDISGFESVSITSIFDAEIIQGSDWEVTLQGNEEDLDDVVVKMVNDDLEVQYSRDLRDWDEDREKVKVFIVMPDLEELDISGTAQVNVTGFEQNMLHVDLSGAAKAVLNVDVRDLDLGMGGISSLTLFGEGNRVEIGISGACNLDASEFEAEEVYLDASGLCKVKINASEILEIDASGGSEVRYKGNPQVQSQRSAGARIIKE